MRALGHSRVLVGIAALPVVVVGYALARYYENGKLTEYLNAVGIDYLANVDDSEHGVYAEETLGWERIFRAEAPPVLRSSRYGFLYTSSGSPQVYKRNVYVYRRPAE